MKISKFIAMAVILLAPLATSMAAEPPKLVGTWAAIVTVLLETPQGIKKIESTNTFVIERQEGQFVYGYQTWKIHGPVRGNVEGKEVHEAHEPFIGVVDSTGQTIRAAETDDPGTFMCKVLGPDSLEISYLEVHPHAVVWDAVFKRAK